jgi:hypothetical protein
MWAPARAQLTTLTPTGTWTVVSSGKPFAATIVLRKGDGLSGTYGKGGTLSGAVDPDNLLQYDLHWSDARGHGWATIVFDAGYESFTGAWGTIEGKPAGTFTALRAVKPDPPIAGLWDVTVTGPVQQNARIAIKAKGEGYGAAWAGGEASGLFSNHDGTMSGIWQAAGRSGTFVIRFTPDGKNFGGTWGFADQPPSGQVAGKRV